MNKKLLIVTSGTLPVPPIRGGAIENRVKYLIDYNDIHNQYDIIVTSVYEPGIEKYNHFKNTRIEYYHNNKIKHIIDKLLRRIFKKFWFPEKVMYINFVKECIKKHDPDIILIENKPDILSLIKSKKSKIFLHLGNDMLNSNMPKREIYLKKLNGVLTVSDYISNCVLEGLDSEPCPVVKIPQGVELSKYKNVSYKFRKEIQDKYSIDENEILILFWGRIEKTKGVIELINAYNLLNKKNIRLMIIGDKSPWQKESPYFNKVKELIDKSNGSIIGTGAINKDIIPTYLSLGNIAVLPSLWNEPGGNVILEALAAGLPLISTNTGGTKEYCNEKCAILLEVDDNIVSKLKDAIENLIDNESLRKSMSSEAREFISEYSEENHIKSVFNAIENLY